MVLHNAQTDEVAEVGIDGRFEGEIRLDLGRNDLLVLLFDAAGASVAFAVVTVMQEQNRKAGDFADGTFGFTRNGRVEFTLPVALAQREVNGESSYWVRTRLLRGNYGQEATYRPVTPTTDPISYELVPATFAPPAVAAIELGYVYEPHGPLDVCLSYNDFTYVNHTTAATSTDDQLFLPFTPTTDTRPALYLGFDRPFANRTMTLYAGVEPPVYSAEAEAKRSAAHGACALGI